MIVGTFGPLATGSRMAVAAIVAAVAGLAVLMTWQAAGAQTPPNTLPTAVADAAATAFETPVIIAVLANDSDPDPGDVLSVTGVTAPLNGGAVANVDNTVTYTPNAGFSGVDIFSYTISDGNGGVASAPVTVDVAADDTPDAGSLDAVNIEVTLSDGEVITLTGPATLDELLAGILGADAVVTGPATGEPAEDLDLRIRIDGDELRIDFKAKDEDAETKIEIKVKDDETKIKIESDGVKFELRSEDEDDADSDDNSGRRDHDDHDDDDDDNDDNDDNDDDDD